MPQNLLLVIATLVPSTIVPTHHTHTHTYIHLSILGEEDLVRIEVLLIVDPDCPRHRRTIAHLREINKSEMRLDNKLFMNFLKRKRREWEAMREVVKKPCSKGVSEGDEKRRKKEATFSHGCVEMLKSATLYHAHTTVTRAK